MSLEIMTHSKKTWNISVGCSKEGGMISNLLDLSSGHEVREQDYFRYVEREIEVRI